MTRETTSDRALRTEGSAGPEEPADPPSTFLVTRSPTTEIGQDACTDALTLQPPSTANLLVITHERSPDEWLETWRRRIGETPANRAIVTVGSTTRSAARSTSPAGGRERPNGTDATGDIFTVTDPGDLTRLGIVVNERIDAWRENDHRTVVCGGSLTAMLQWVELPVLFRFLHVLLQRLRTADALVHFHLHPDAHPERTGRTLEPLFDRVIDEPLNRSMDDGDGRPAVDDDVVLDLLESPRRRYALQCLVETGSARLDDLAVAVAAREADRTPEAVSDMTRERTSISLHHNHLAKLDAAGLVDYDAADHTVELAADETLVRTCLERLDGDP